MDQFMYRASITIAVLVLIILIVLIVINVIKGCTLLDASINGAKTIAILGIGALVFSVLIISVLIIIVIFLLSWVTEVIPLKLN